MPGVHDLKWMHKAWASQPLVQVTKVRTNGDEPLVHLGHALRDEFRYVGRDLDQAIEQAMEMTRASRHLMDSTEPAFRATGVLQAKSGLYITGLNSSPFHPNDLARGLELQPQGVIGRVGLAKTARPGFEANQITAPDIYMGEHTPGFGAPQFRKLVDELVAVAGPNSAARL